MSEDDEPNVTHVRLGDVDGGLVEAPGAPGGVSSYWFCWLENDGDPRALPWDEAVQRFGPPRLS